MRPDFVWPVVGVLFGFVLAASAAVRRQRPLAVVLIGFGGFAAIDVISLVTNHPPFVLSSGSVVLIFAFSLFRWDSARHAALGLVTMTSTLVTASVVDDPSVEDVIGGAALLLLASVLGASIRYRRSARHQLIEQARSNERQAIARELHDTVAHHVSAIAVVAQAGLVEADRHPPGSAAGAFEVIVDEATRTLTEMRSIVGILLVDSPAAVTAIVPTSEGLEQLLQRSTDDTVVVVHTSGDVDALPPMAAFAILRIARESVTNALRHARHATRIGVAVDATSNEVTLVVSDDGDPVGSASSGFGLTGMSERVALLGGHFEAGPAPVRGWQVCAVLPRHGSYSS